LEIPNRLEARCEVDDALGVPPEIDVFQEGVHDVGDDAIVRARFLFQGVSALLEVVGHVVLLGLQESPLLQEAHHTRWLSVGPPVNEVSQHAEGSGGERDGGVLEEVDQRDVEGEGGVEVLDGGVFGERGGLLVVQFVPLGNLGEEGSGVGDRVEVGVLKPVEDAGDEIRKEVDEGEVEEGLEGEEVESNSGNHTQSHHKRAHGRRKRRGRGRERKKKSTRRGGGALL